jgi:hypothetical protein
MNRYVTLAASVVGAGALVGSVLSQALASAPPFHDAAASKVKHYNIKGALTITDVLRVNKNLSDYGKVYAHGGQQVWKGLTVTGGGKIDSLAVSGALQAASGTVGGVTLQGGSINGTSLTTTGDGHVGGALAVTGKVTSTGLDAGTGGITTTGNISGGALTASSINTTGALTAGSVSTTGTLQAATLKVTSGVDFTGATVAGLNLGNVNLNNATLSQLNVSSALTAGSTSSSSNPLTLQGNGQAVALGVNSNGALTASNVAIGTNETVGGNLTVSGTSGITSPIVQSASTSSQLTLQGGPVVIKGATTLSNNTNLAGGSDLNLSASTSGTASHINASGDADLAGTLALTVPTNTGTPAETDVSYTFAKSYATTPIVVVTPTNEPSETAAKATAQYWVTSSAGSFTIHYVPGSTVTSGYTIHFNYVVVGQ